MSQFCIYLEVPVYISQYLRHHFGDPCVFDRNLPMNKIIKLFIEKQPSGKNIETLKDNMVSITIPDQPNKPAEYWNYLPDTGKKALLESINSTIDCNLYNEMQKIIPNGVKLMTAIRGWCRKHGIDLEYENTIKQKYYRVRDAFEKSGIDLKRSFRNRDEDE